MLDQGGHPAYNVLVLFVLLAFPHIGQGLTCYKCKGSVRLHSSCHCGQKSCLDCHCCLKCCLCKRSRCLMSTPSQFVFFEQHTCGLWGEHTETCASNTEYCTLVMRQQSGYNFMYTGTAPRMLDQPWQRGCATYAAVQGNPYQNDPAYQEVPGQPGLKCKSEGRKLNGEEEIKCLCTSNLCNDRISGAPRGLFATTALVTGLLLFPFVLS